MSIDPLISLAAFVSIDLARREWEQDGVISTTAYIAMTSEGVDADAIISLFEETI